MVLSPRELLESVRQRMYKDLPPPCIGCIDPKDYLPPKGEVKRWVRPGHFRGLTSERSTSKARRIVGD